MTNTDTDLKVLQDALTTLRNMGVRASGYQTVSRHYAETYADTLRAIVSLASNLHLMCESTIVANAIAVCTEAGYEVKSPQ